MRSIRIATVVAVAASLLVGCSSDGAPDGGGDASPTVASANPAIVADSSLSDPAQYATNGSVEEDPGFVQVDANTATTEQLVAAFTTNGIADPTIRAAEVVAHRPYATTTQFGEEFDELRDALTTAGLNDFDVEAIVASLTVT